MKQDLPTSLIVNCLDVRNDKATLASQREEIKGLTRAIGLQPSAVVDIKIRNFTPRTYLTKGKVEEVLANIQLHNVALVIFNGQLTSRQQEALEKEWDVKVLDRTALILEIFGKRARSREAKLQTDLAQLAYQKGRLVRSWTHLERQRGGAGFMGGPGERQIESDRRQIANKIKKISLKLEAVRRRRAQNRAARQKTSLPVVALVGYTNAGKSTLFNLLTKEQTQARNILFDTLDTKMRQMNLPDGTKAILSDTVGFISNLPHDLVAAFRATLEEVSEANIIIHVRDFSHPDTLIQKQNVEEILSPLRRGQPMIEVLNKIDQTTDQPMASAATCAISALTGQGVEELFAHLGEVIKKLQQRTTFSVTLPLAEITAQKFIYEKGQVLCQKSNENNWYYEVILSKANAGFLQKNFAKVKVVPLEVLEASSAGPRPVGTSPAGPRAAAVKFSA